jgi:molybdopterin/thiamine biosynthesis adenylyltransferase
MKDFSYKELISRNWGYFTPDEQHKIANTSVLMCGCGLGSLVADLLARSGFCKFVLADGDNVELSNLNRQAFLLSQVGTNKAQATAERIRSINPQAEVESFPQYITFDDTKNYLDKAEIIINTVDLTSNVFPHINAVARSMGKPVLFPMNLGWGGVLLVFTPEAVSLEELMGPNWLDNPYTSIIQSVAKRIRVPDELLPLMEKFLRREEHSWPYDPQLGISAYASAMLTTTAIIKLVLGKPVKVVPECIQIDLLGNV